MRRQNWPGSDVTGRPYIFEPSRAETGFSPPSPPRGGSPVQHAAAALAPVSRPHLPRAGAAAAAASLFFISSPLSSLPASRRRSGTARRTGDSPPQPLLRLAPTAGGGGNRGAFAISCSVLSLHHRRCVPLPQGRNQFIFLPRSFRRLKWSASSVRRRGFSLGMLEESFSGWQDCCEDFGVLLRIRCTEPYDVGMLLLPL